MSLGMQGYIVGPVPARFRDFGVTLWLVSKEVAGTP